MNLGLGGYPPLLVAVRNRVADYGGLPRGDNVFIGPRPLGSRRAPASPSRTHSCQELQPGYHKRWRLCGRRAKRVWLCPPSRVVVPPHPCRMPAEDTVRPRQCALQVAGPTQSQCHPTQPYTHPIQPHPVRTSLALQTYPALHIILSSPPHLLSSPLLWRGSGAGPSARARWYSCCSSAACCPEAAHRPRRLRQRRAPASRARQTSRRPGAACPTAWPKCENERPLRRLDACPKSCRGLPEVSGPGFDHADRAPHPSY